MLVLKSIKNLGNVRCETLEISAPISSLDFLAALNHNSRISLLRDFLVSCFQLPGLSACSHSVSRLYPGLQALGSDTVKFSIFLYQAGRGFLIAMIWI